MGSLPGVQESRGGLDPSVLELGMGTSLGTLVTKISTWRASLETRAMHLLTIEAHHEICAERGERERCEGVVNVKSFALLTEFSGQPNEANSGYMREGF